MINRTKLLAGAAILAMSQPTMALDYDAYASLRLGVEAVDPDNAPGNFDSYVGFRDAYSRAGIKISQDITPDWSVLLQGEVPLDLANLDIHSPFDNTEHVRIAKIQLSGPLGTLWYGRGWLAYYNYIAYPLDWFSSYYSGWATFTPFRRYNTTYYATPRIAGLQAAAMTTADNPGSRDNRNQYVISYSKDGLSLAGALDDVNNAADLKIWGASASWKKGPWYVAAKYEELDYGTPNTFDGDSVKNLLVQYSVDDKNTVRGMLADVGWNYGGTVLHLGWDHQYNDQLKVFVEYYQEETTAAIADERKSPGFGSASFNAPATSGGRVITTGVRYDF